MQILHAYASIHPENNDHNLFGLVKNKLEMTQMMM